MESIIHIRPSVVRDNIAKGAEDPCIIVRQNGRERLAAEVVIHGSTGAVVARIAPQFKNPIQTGLGKGACVWVETDCNVELLGESWPTTREFAPEMDDATDTISL